MSNLTPNRRSFGANPLGYGATASQKWELARSIATGTNSNAAPTTGANLKNPILWLTHAHALAEAARAVIEHEPSWESMPVWVRSACDSQYCAAGLMLVGYSLEVCLKAMLILSHGVDQYTNDEQKYKHHKLERLAEFLPNLGAKDRAIMRGLTHYIEWAGRYPDPGGGHETKREEIFSLAEEHQIAAKDLFSLAAAVMRHVQVVVEQHAK